MRNDFTSAAAAIAAECATKRWDQSVTVADTHGWLNADSIHDWIDAEVGLRSPQSILAELASRLTDAEALSLLHAIGHDKDAVYDPLEAALDALVTVRLVEAAEAIIDPPAVCPACHGKGATAPNGVQYCNCDEPESHIRVITGTGNARERKQLDALCRGLKVTA